MLLNIVSPERVEFRGEVSRVKVPGSMGQFEILEHHAPIISSLDKGAVQWDPSQPAAEAGSLSILSGFVSVNKNEVNICVEV